MSHPKISLVLASTSPFRRELLARLGLPFRCVAPAVEESVEHGELPSATAVRLARAKAEAGGVACPGALVIGSDQVAELDGRALGKPGTTAAARAQLAACSGREVRFHTAICLCDTRQGDWRSSAALDDTVVRFRRLGAAEIARYVEREDVLACAGSFRAEGLGITLFEDIVSDDPTSLLGLPLIQLSRLLRAAGVTLP